MNGIYLSQDLSHAGGIEKKIFRQIEELEKAGFTITKHINPRRNFFHLLKNVFPFFSVQYFGTRSINWNNYDFVYMRKGAIFDKSVVQLLKTAKESNPNLLVILEIPTYPYLEEFKGLLKWDVQLKEKQWVPHLKNYVDRIVTYSNDQEIFGIPCINISNAYDFAEFNRPEIKQDTTIHLLGVAALCFYHGYDRIIEGLKQYYQSNNSSTKVIFTLIGDGPVLKDYQKLVAEYQLEEYVHLTGRKPFSELDKYYKTADIGIDSLARHRSGVTYNSSLKGKEYLAKGLPIVSGVKTDLDDRNLPFYFRVASDDSPVNIQKIIDWYNKLTVFVSKEKLAEEISNYGKANFTFEKTFEPVIHCIKGEGK